VLIVQNRRSTKRIGRGSIAGGLILILVGMLWLLNNLGYLPGDFVRSLWRFWPLALIVVGLEVALQGFSDRVALPILLLAAVLIGAVVVVLAPTLPAEQTVTDSFSQEVGSLDSASIELEFDDATLQIEALQGQPDLLATAQLDHSSNLFIQKEFEESSGRGNLSLADRYEVMFPYFFLGGLENDWALQLTPDIPLDLQLEGDDSELNLNLEGLTLNTLTANLDECSGQVRLSTTAGLDAELDIEDSRLTIIVPSSVGARVVAEISDSDVDFDTSRFVEIGPGEYLSEGYEEAQILVHVSLQASDSTITIQ
jgi:hypothetical protein